jgi:hypothetical protein
MLVQDGKLACTSFPPQWNDVVRDALIHYWGMHTSSLSERFIP